MSLTKPFRPGLALAYALLIWITGFIWGSIVFMTPSLKSVEPIPWISKNPIISFPLLVLWPALAFLVTKSYLKRTDDKAAEGLRLGITLAVVNFILDLLVLVLMLKAGFSYFASLTVCLAYLLLIVVPWLTGRSLQRP